MKPDLEDTQGEKIAAAHMTRHGLYLSDDAKQKVVAAEVARIHDPEEELHARVGGRTMPRSLSSKSRGGEFGTPKFKEILKIKNFKQKITELFKSKRRSDIQD